MPEQAIERWRAVVLAEKHNDWRLESQDRLARAERRLADRAKRVDAVAAFNDSAVNVKGATDLALTVAVERWLPQRAQFGPELEHLASLLEERHHDRWLRDILQLPESREGRQAFEYLAAACRGNSSNDGAGVVENARQAESIFQKLRSPAGEVRARVERVYALHRNGQPEDSRQSLEGIRTVADTHSWVWIRDQAWLEELYRKGQLGTFDTAREREQALASIQADGYEGLRIRALGFLTDAHISLTHPLRAWQDARGGLLDYWNGVLPLVRVHVFYYALANDAQTRGLARAAVALMGEAIKAVEQTGYRSVLAFELSLLGTLQAQAGQNQLASATFDRTKEIYARLDPSKLQTFAGLAEIQHAEAETIAGHAQQALTILDGAKGQSWAGQTTVSYRTARGNALLQSGRLSQAADEFGRLIQANRQNLRNVAGRAQREAAFLNLAPAFRGLTETQQTLGQTAQALETWHEFRGGRLNNESPRPHLRAGTALLTLALLRKDISAWWMDDTAIEQHWINRGEVLSLAGQLADLAADKKSQPSQVNALARRLYALIFSPFERRLGRSSYLIIDADGSLAAIPWLVLEDAAGHALVERFAIVDSFGWAEIASRESVTSAYRSPLIVAAPRLDPDLEKFYPPLTDALEEASNIRRKLPKSTLVSGSAATRAALFDAMPSADLLHFAGHGISGGGFGALLLAPGRDGSLDSQLTGREISQLQLSRLRLVFLSACSTAVGEVGTVNLDSLVRAFLEAGAGRVVGARWEIDSSATSRLVDRFYDSLLAGAPPAEALRQAATTVRQRHAHPYYWAGLQLYGAP